MLAYTFWCIDRFQNHRNLNSDLYPWKSSGPNDKHFQGLPYNNFSNTFYEYSQFLRSILPFNLLIYSSVQNRSALKYEVCSEKYRRRQSQTRWASGQYETMPLSAVG